MLIQQNTTSSFGFPLPAGFSPAGGLSLFISQNGGAFTAASGSCNWSSQGSPALPYAAVVLASADTSTLGQLQIMVSDGAVVTAACPFEMQVVAFDPQDAAGLGLSRLDAAVSSRGTSNFAGGAVASVSSPVTVGTNNDKTGYSLTSAEETAIANALLDETAGVETSKTVRQALRLMLAALAGKLSLAGTSVTIRDTNDTKDRITATVDANGERLAVSYDVS